VWLGDSFPGAVWVAPVAGLILIAVKVIEVVRAGPADGPQFESFSAAPQQRSKAQRILWG